MSDSTVRIQDERFRNRTGQLLVHLPHAIKPLHSELMPERRPKQWDTGNDATVTELFVGPDQLLSVVYSLIERLHGRDLDTVRVIFTEDGQESTPAARFNVHSLPEFLARLHRDWLLELMSCNRLTTFFQPIVHSATPRRLLGYECLMRGQDDVALVSPQRLLQIARGAHLVQKLDIIAARTSLQEAARFGIFHKLFVNIAPVSTDELALHLVELEHFVDALCIERDQVVLEVVESERIRDVVALKRILGHCRNAGFRVALDDLGSGYSSLNLMHELRPDYIKLDMALVRNVDREPYKACLLEKLIEAIAELGLKSIAEGVESVEEYQWLTGHHVDYQQGYLFARPASPPPPVNHLDKTSG